jgi:hypothetical protein
MMARRGSGVAGRIAMGNRAATVSGPSDGRPVGPGYVSWEQLYRTGDSVQAVINKVTNRDVLTLPEGRFEGVDFVQGYMACLNVPSACGGLVGVDPGAFGQDRGTIFTVKPMSNSRTSLVPIQTPGGTATNEFMLLKSADAPGPLEFRNFAWEGTNQGDDYHGNYGGFKIHNQRYGVVVDRVRGAGWKGDAGAPPGEMMGFYINGYGQIVASNIALDGRREVDGPMFGAVGMTVQNNNGASLSNITTRSCRAAGFVAFQSTNGKIMNLTIDSATALSSSELLGNGGLNLERTTGWEITNLDILGRQKKVHITHSNDNYVLNTPAGSYPVANGSLVLIDPKWNDLWGNGRLYAQSWDPYGVGAGSAYGGNSMLWPSGAMKVFHTDGVVRVYQHIISGTGHVMNSVPLPA